MWMKTSTYTDLRSLPVPVEKTDERRRATKGMCRLEGQIGVNFRNKVSGSASNSWGDGIVVAHPFVRMGTAH
jgi:hypothetical protein